MKERKLRRVLIWQGVLNLKQGGSKTRAGCIRKVHHSLRWFFFLKKAPEISKDLYIYRSLITLIIQIGKWRTETHFRPLSKVWTQLLQTFFKYQLNAHFLYSITICMLHSNPQHVSSSTLLIFRRTNCIITSSGVVTLCKQPYSMPAYCTVWLRSTQNT